ncbi:general secretion pathway protein GspF [Sphingobacterium mizutaii NBRC 14946 = DSM 11724]|uniref:General secretion pathway protein F n=2 Tax=Sphingobacterium mizutaii TaxID=1010 RepID=A0AAJ4X8B8_9SPHI|nr:type II secretion system F family protein [Sphingobacterium mizutaii]GEM68746.1 general secretion pathway protein GspF [Sphingobacterium mizutaii NBRC 14946 = DSM 11724]SDL85248.1 type IV pilus assembly protein PilC [Sphingobacterium mizutaii]SNV36793.1 Cholera toxin secretion protein epsF [Sphingobacterium mizutaii]
MSKVNISRYKKVQHRVSKSNPKGTHRKTEGKFDLLEFLNRDISFGNKQLSDKKKEEFYLEFSTLLLSGIDIRTAFDLILVDQKNKKGRSVFEHIQEDVIAGFSLSEAIYKSNKFSSYEVHSIKIGEETGKIGDILQELALYFKSRISQRRKIVSAITYPLIVLLTSFGAVFFMLKFVVPMFADVFKKFGRELPWVTQFILNISELIDATFYLNILVIASIIFILYYSQNKLWFRKWSSWIILRIPFVNEIVKKIHLARFANTMRLLISTNIPLIQAIQLLQQMTEFYPIQISLDKIEQSILHGQSLHSSLEMFDFYPKKMIQLIKVGEEVNRLDFFFEKISHQYTEEIEYKTSTISTVMEPLIIIFLGLVVGLILVAMYLPMFQMSNSF